MADLIHVTMTKEAAEQFKSALSYGTTALEMRAETLIDENAPAAEKAEKMAEWLRWGYSRTHLALNFGPDAAMSEAENAAQPQSEGETG